MTEQFSLAVHKVFIYFTDIPFPPQKGPKLTYMALLSSILSSLEPWEGFTGAKSELVDS